MIKNNKITLQKQAYQKILEKIRRNEYVPGQEIREAPIAQELGISITPVREAIHLLEREGWIEILPYRGAFMRKFTKTEFRTLSVMRESLEVTCVSYFIDNATAEDIQALEDNIAQMLSFYHLGRKGEMEITEAYDKIYESDSKFHELIIQGAHCPGLATEATKWSMLLQCTFISGSKTSVQEHFEQVPSIIRQHQAISTALQMKWKDAAAQLLKTHISNNNIKVKMLVPTLCYSPEVQENQAGFTIKENITP